MEISEEKLPLLDNDDLTTNNDETIVEKPYNGYKYKTAEEALEARRASKRKYNEKMRHKNNDSQSSENILQQINLPWSITPDNKYGTNVVSPYPEIFLPLAKILENIAILMGNVEKLAKTETPKKE